MFSRILVCMDLTQESELLVKYALDQARCSGGSVILAHVIDMPQESVPISFRPGANEREELVDVENDDIHEGELTAMSYLENHARDLRDKGVPAEGVIIRGTPGESITAFAEENSIDLIIITNPRKNVIGRAVFGSVTDHVLHHADAAVLAIRTGDSGQ